MDFAFTGDLVEWRGPAPYHFVGLPEELAADVAELAVEVTYGWGMIPVRVRIGATEWETSLWPKDGGYLLPVKDKVRGAESLRLGDRVDVGLTVATRDGRLVHRDA